MAQELKENLSRDLITQLSNKKNEPEWMLNLRLKAYDLYQELPIPKVDKIKIDKWNMDQFSLIPGSAAQEKDLNELPEEIRTFMDKNTEDRSVLIHKNSEAVFKQLAKELNAQGVIFMDLGQALKEYPELIEKYFAKSVAMDENKIVALHTATWNSGAFLYVPKNVEVEFPIQSIYLAEEEGLLPHIIIVAEENSSVTYVDHHFSNEQSETVVNNSVVEVFVKAGAKVRFATIHNFSEHVYDYTFRKALVERDGTVEWVIGEMNDGNTVSNNTSILKGSAASAFVKSIFIGTGKQKTSFTAQVVHEGTHTVSDILSHGVMLDDSTAIFNGITKIVKNAVKSDATQAEKVLMLSEGARGDANPILLIDEYDVIAGHAASAGPINKEDIYYLMSRGISKKEAERLITHGFLAPVVSRIPIEGLQDQLENVIERKLRK